MDLKALGAYIHNKRQSLGISPSELAGKAEVGRTTLWILERGENPKTGKPSRPTKDLLERLGFVLCLEPAEIDTLLELAGYTVRRPSAALPAQQATPARSETLLPVVSAFVGNSQDYSALVNTLIDALAEHRKQLIKDIKDEFRQVIREVKVDRPSPFPRFYPAVTTDRFWYIIDENDAHNGFQRELSQGPVSLVGSHFFEMYFWLPIRQAMDASGQWLPRAIRTVAGFRSMLADYLREAPQRRHEYDALIDRLSSRLLDFAHVYESAGRVAPMLPERTTAPQHISTNHFYLPLRPSGGIDLVFDSTLVLPRADYSEQTLTLVPANDEARIALILLCLAHTPLLAEHGNAPLRQALWWLSAIKTVEEGLTHAGPDRWWEPQEAFSRIRSERERVAPEVGRLTAEMSLAELQETIARLANNRGLERRLLIQLLLHFTDNPATLNHCLAKAGEWV
jgi:transcriptional regulator with XRE-family HTH domain